MGLGSEGLLPGLLGHDAADVDEIISDHAEADQALHSGIAPVAAAIETVSPLDHADATLASGAPFLAVAEPALLLLAFSSNGRCTAQRAGGRTELTMALAIARTARFWPGLLTFGGASVEAIAPVPPALGLG
jgi:hypothetical protein